jgi:quercetin dioxygenase-like cupin family protein
MEKQINRRHPAAPRCDRLLDAPLLNLALPALIAQVKQVPAWHTSDRNALTVFKTGTLCFVLLALHAGAEVKTHAAPGTIRMQVLAGTITFSTAAPAADLRARPLLTLHAGVPHRVVAAEEAVFLLLWQQQIIPRQRVRRQERGRRVLCPVGRYLTDANEASEQNPGPVAGLVNHVVYSLAFAFETMFCHVAVRAGPSA